MNTFYYDLAVMLEKQIKPSVLKSFLEHLPSAESFYKLSTQEYRELCGQKGIFKRPYITEERHRKIMTELEFMNRHQIQFCRYTDSFYPTKLKSCIDAPLGFFYKGNIPFNNAKSISIVGTRQASEEGLEMTRQFVKDLAPYSVTIVSGLAYGIDSAAHKAALEYQMSTIGILGHGMSFIYPKENKDLSQRMMLNGGIISEYFAMEPCLKSHFPKRNRIIAGMSEATIVIESAQKGGSLITAYIANSYNRDVFAFPGKITDMHHQGCHLLIKRNYASLIENAADFLDMMNWNMSTPMDNQPKLFNNLNKDEEIICNFIAQKKECLMDQLIEEFTQFTPSKLASLLLGLELKSIITTKPGQRYFIKF